MVTTTLDHNPLDPNYAKRRSSLGNMDEPQKAVHDVKELTDRNVAPYAYLNFSTSLLRSISKFTNTLITRSPHAMCSELAHQHALDDLHKNTEHWSNQDVDHSMSSRSNQVHTLTHNRKFPI